ncbi:MAG: alanine racemase [Planctomycetota bacterium]|nr:alanine racemase [Planctomycetota bacterium]
MPRPTYAEIDLRAIRRNFRALKSRLQSGVRMLAIIKADAYGHGAAAVGLALEKAGADMFGVALVEEGVALRKAGLRAPILVMGIAPEDEVVEAMRSDLAVTVDSVATAAALQRHAVACGCTARVHLKIDTGMNRLGLRAEAVPEAAVLVAGMDHLKLEGAYTHFACADEDDEKPSRDQLVQLKSALAGLRAAGITPPLVHAANSAAILRIATAHFDMVRSGLALYGIRPCAAAPEADLQPVLALKSRVAHLKRVPRGEGVSYGHRWQAARDSIIGVLPIGYADGYRRILSNRAQVRIAGRLCPVRGTICMDATMVDLTDVPGAEVGLEATLLEAAHDSPLSAAALAELCDTIPYEILTGISSRVPRVYVE